MTDEIEGRGRTLADCTVKLVSGYVTNNNVVLSELPAFIGLVAQTLNTLAVPQSPSRTETIKRPTKGEIEKSIQRDALISFIDGKAYKALRRHLANNGHTPESYRVRYGLPIDYPMVSPSYSARRSEISKQISIKRGHLPQRDKLH